MANMKSKDQQSRACCGEADKVEETGSTSRSSCCADSKETPNVANDSDRSQLAEDSPAVQKRLDIDFLYLDLSVCTRCQGTASTLDAAIAEVARILEATGVQTTVNKTHVKSEEQAAALGLRVSPTIRVNGRDIQMNFRESRCESCEALCDCEDGVTCREWEYQGQWHTVPPKGLIIEAILKALYGGAPDERGAPHETKGTPDNLKQFFASVRK